jgi:TRAP-type uncharacterized transport system substrate-binding protein
MQRSLLWACAVAVLAGQAFAQVRQPSPAFGQAHPRRPSPDARLRDALRSEVNSGLVGIISGSTGDADFDEISDLAASFDRRRDRLRLLPVVGQGALQNATDVVFARGIDIGIIQMDVLAELKRDPPFPGIETYLQYITKLYDEEVHLLAGKDIRTVADLASKKVNFGLRTSGTYTTASAVFDALGVAVEATSYPQPAALEKLRSGEISALVYVVGKPARLFRDVRPDEPLHFLSIPPIDDRSKVYAPARLTGEDYPELIEMDKPIATLAIGTVLVTYNWPAGGERYQNVARFVRAFFQDLQTLRNPPHHPKWRDVDPTAAMPGWTRFAAAEQWIKTAGLDREDPLRLQQAAKSGGAGTPEPRQREALFTEFLEYRKRQAAAASSAGPIDAARLDALFTEFVDYQKRLNASGSAMPRREARQKEGWRG